MWHLALSSFRKDRKALIAPFIILLIAGLLTTTAISLLFATPPHELPATEYQTLTKIMSNLAGLFLVFTGIPIILSVSSTSSLSILEHENIYASWRLAGITPHQVARIIQYRTLALSLLAGTISSIAALFSTQPLLEYFLTALVKTPIALPVPGVFILLLQIILSVLALMIFAYLGAQRPARQATGIKPIALLQQSPHHTISRKTPGRTTAIVCFIITAILAVSALLSAVSDPEATIRELLRINGDEANINEFNNGMAGLSEFGPSNLLFAAGFVMLYALTLIILVWISSPLFMHKFIRKWTGMIPIKQQPTWYLARQYTLTHTNLALSAIRPFVLAASLMTLMFSFIAGLEQALAPSQSEDTASILFILGPGALLAVAASVASLVITANNRSAYQTDLRLAGMSRKQLLTTTALEAFIYATTAFLLSLAVLILSALMLGICLKTAGYPFVFVIDFKLLLFICGSTLLGILLAMLTPTYRISREKINEAL